MKDPAFLPAPTLHEAKHSGLLTGTHMADGMADFSADGHQGSSLDSMVCVVPVDLITVQIVPTASLHTRSHGERRLRPMHAPAPRLYICVSADGSQQACRGPDLSGVMISSML